MSKPTCYSAKAYSATSNTAALGPSTIERREPGPRDVQVQILYCGVCHSDIHIARNEWGGTMYPCVPGHEIVGKITKVGGEVKKFKVGDIAAVGCMVASCRACPSCQSGFEQFCERGAVFTYNSVDPVLGGPTLGGYSQSIVVTEEFCFKVPPNLDLAATAPLLCAGITTYSPLRHWQAGPGKKVGIIGLGGLGHMGVKFAHAFGAHVVLFTTSANKTEDARRLGADEVVISKDDAQMRKHGGSFDLILDTVSAEHDMNAYLSLLKRDGTLVVVGVPGKPLSVAPFSVIVNRRSLAGSSIGGVPETQEMLDFCGQHGITCDIEMIRIDQLNEAYTRMLKSDVKYRFVIDVASLR